MLTELGAALYGRKRIIEARAANDINTEVALEAYYKADTILLNYLVENGSFDKSSRSGKLNFTVMQKAMLKFSDYLNQTQKGDSKSLVPQAYSDFNREIVWNNFRT
jgi:hypothetical protein